MNKLSCFTLNTIKYLNDGVDPLAGDVVDVVDPDQVASTQESSDDEASLLRWEVMFDQEKLTQLERDDCGVHAVVDQRREVVIKNPGEDEFSVHSPDTPEDDTNKHTNGEGC